MFVVPGAATDIWVGPAAADWDTAADWSAAAVPGTSDVVYIPSNNTVTYDSSTDSAINALDVDGTLSILSYTLTVAGNSSPGTAVVTDNGTISLGGAGTVSAGGGLALSGNQALLTGTGAVVLSSGVFATNANDTLNVNGTIASNIVVQGQHGLIYVTTNNGLIDAEGNDSGNGGISVRFNGTLGTNNGVITAVAGGMVTAGSSNNFTNTGTLSAGSPAAPCRSGRRAAQTRGPAPPGRSLSPKARPSTSAMNSRRPTWPTSPMTAPGPSTSVAP